MAEVNVRALVADSLVEMEKDGTFLSAIEQAVLDKYDHIDARDKAFYKRVLSGTVERKIRIDYILGLFSGTKINKMKPFIRAVLRSSIYQIMWMDNVPDSAVCNEAVKLVNKRKLGGLKGFVNGVLRNICRNKDKIEYPDPEKEKLKYLSVYYSCPEWIAEKFLKEEGPEKTERILAASMEERPVSVRFRCGADKARELKDAWKKRGIEVKDYRDMDDACLIKGADGIRSLEGFDEGLFVIQDYGSMMVARLAGVCPGDLVMDLCAAPGGKSIHASDILSGISKDPYIAVKEAGPTDGQNENIAEGHIYSYDLSEEKCDRIRENIDRLNIGNITVTAHDARVFMPDMEAKADLVIVDAPCSGLGVIGHKSDIKYRLKEDDITSLSELQRKIIDNAVRYVKPGGKLVYSTCTISQAENSDNRRYIIDRYGFKPVAADGVNEELKLLPGFDQSDGFYITVLKNG